MTRQTNSCLPRGWVCAALGDVVEPSDKKVDPADAQNMLYIGLEHIAKDNGKLLGHGHANDVKSTKTVFHAGDLLYGRLRPYLNKVHVVDCDGICSTDILVFPANPYRSNKFLLYRILCSDFVSFVSRNMSGVQHPRVSSNTISLFPVSLPPLPEQHRIVAKIEELLTRLDAGVEALTKIKAQLKRYRQAVLKHAFEGNLTAEWREAHKHELEPASVLLERIKQERQKNARGRYKELPPLDASSLPGLPDAWAWTRIGDISDSVQYGYTASSTTETSGPKMLRITDIQHNSVNWGAVPYCRIGSEEKERYLLKDGDLVFARTGATVGKSFLVENPPPESVFASYLIRITLSRQVNKRYVYGFFQSHDYWGQIHAGRLGIGQPNVNSETLSRILVPLCSFPEQRCIVDEIERRFSVVEQIEKTVDQGLKQAERLRQSILKKAFEGKLVPQDPDDEPAGILLERIKGEREEQRAAGRSARNSRK